GGGGTAAASGAGQASAGLAAKAGIAKIALAVAGTVAAAAGGAVVYETTRPEPEPVAARVEVTLASLDRAYPDRSLNVRGGQYARVTGLPDASVQTSVNEALRVPLDQAIAFYGQWGGAACGGRANVLGTRAVIGLRGPDLVSVRYVPRVERICGEAPDRYPGFVATVDLRTGRALTADDVFKPAAFAEPGLRQMWDGIPDGADKQQLARGHSGSGGFFLPFRRDTWFPSSQRPKSPPWSQPFFREGRFELVHVGLSFGASSEQFGLNRTSTYAFPIPYAKVRSLFKPELAALLPAS
ncbi:hypothetical protein, partial [Actinomadura sp. CNU-125]|uniref:hypothetical protein n=1 Tax=Actinomadura sp. CNU-125 TaxID=1904961 RepID=UPI0021CCE370